MLCEYYFSFFSKISYCTIFSVMMWDDKMPMWWDKWDERCRHCDTVLDYYSPSDNMSGGGLSASDVFVDHWVMMMVRCQEADSGGGWGSQVGISWDFIMLLRIACSLELMNWLFPEFST